ncbi:MAG: hypothetical protein SFX73_14365 [Kofleriaceae bacterium]|nr:hypothetical protein [Kofleriaceae bacterium]
MATDRSAGYRVAWLVLLAGCGPTVRPDGPAAEPGPVVNELAPKTRPTTARGRQIVVGEMCPLGAGGRPAVAPLVMRTLQWSDVPSDLTNAVERGSIPRFTVYGTDGRSAGAFDTLGSTEVGLPQAIAAGTYVGASPCTADAGKGTRIEDPACGPATSGCGLALGELQRPGDLVTSPVFAVGGACLSGDAIAADLDGDKVAESFPLASLLDGVRSPANEWSAAPTAGATCAPTFQLYDVKLVRPSEPGKPVDTKSMVILDVLGVVDLDGDGMKELVLALRFPTIRTIVVYSPTGTAQRLEMVGEGQSFPR